MDILKDYITIEASSMPTNISIVTMVIDGYVIFKYKLDTKIYFCYYFPKKPIHRYIFFELINKSSLWLISYNIINLTRQNFYNICFTITLNNILINDYINISMGLNSIISELFLELPQFNNPNITDKSYVSYCNKIQQPLNFKLQLYDYQLRTLNKMIAIEKKQINFKINYTTDILLDNNPIIFNPISNIKTNKQLEFILTTNGGILADEMGLGKTITSIGLIVSNLAPLNIPQIAKGNISLINKINSKATVIVCPSHLSKQWSNEIERCNPSLKILMILTKNHYNNLYFKDFIENDIIITSHQFIMNFKFYPTLYYRTCTASSFNFEDRNKIVKTFLQTILTDMNFTEIYNLEQPIFEFFNFHRLILDEGHEIFSEKNGIVSNYMSRWISNIDANYYWYVSGTPFINFTGVKNCAKFINLKLEDIDNNIIIDYTNNINSSIINSYIMSFMNKEYIWNNILNKICIRHLKKDIENEITIPNYTEEIIWLKFTDFEQQLYNTKINKVTDQYLQQLCCHPLVVESSKKIFGNIEVDLSIMHDKLIEYHKNNYENYKYKLNNLDSSKPEYHMLKKTFETHINESKYLFTILEKMKEPDYIKNDNCSICMDELNKPTLTSCGHLFCYDCLKSCLNNKKLCPLCKANLTNTDLLVVNLKSDLNDNNNPLIQKYGSKLGKLISVISTIFQNPDSRIIIFSQWDDMLNLVGKTLAENNIENCFVKGNVWSRNAAINKFKSGKNNQNIDTKVIMLSLKNAASGTNLTEATHIFFVEPINSSKEESMAIESQAIARACRIGQSKIIQVIRILIQDTIEEEIYKRNI
jgi:DNA repair protein RAD5